MENSTPLFPNPDFFTGEVIISILNYAKTDVNCLVIPQRMLVKLHKAKFISSRKNANSREISALSIEQLKHAKFDEDEILQLIHLVAHWAAQVYRRRKDSN